MAMRIKAKLAQLQMSENGQRTGLVRVGASVCRGWHPFAAPSSNLRLRSVQLSQHAVVDVFDRCQKLHATVNECVRYVNMHARMCAHLSVHIMHHLCACIWRRGRMTEKSVVYFSSPEACGSCTKADIWCLDCLSE